jgi:hypothetical protein
VTAEAAGQRRWRTRAGARRSDGDVVGFGHGRWRGRDDACEARRRRQRDDVFGHDRSGWLLTHPAHSDIATMVANQGATRGDTATDRWAPLVGIF